jgi:CYTH domain-containing protein
MPLEIERKFLVANENWRSAVIGSDRLVDGLIGEFNGSKVRVRLGQHKASLAVKGPRSGTTRTEFEYDIPRADAMAILKTVSERQLFEKTRYAVEHAGFVWNIDVYEGRLAGVIITEIELEYENQYFEKPDWVGLEVTDDPLFHKRVMGRMSRDAGRPSLNNQ